MPSTASHSLGSVPNLGSYQARTIQSGYTTSFPALGVTSNAPLASAYSSAPAPSGLANSGPFQFHASPASAFPDYESPSKPSAGGYGGASDLSTSHTEGYGGQYDSNPYGSPPPGAGGHSHNLHGAAPPSHNLHGAAPPTEYRQESTIQPSHGGAKSIDQQLLEELREIRQDISQMKSQIAANYAECMEEARGASRVANQNQMTSQRPQGPPQGYGNEQPPHGGPPMGGPQQMPPYGQGGSFNGSAQGGQPPPRQASTGRPQGPPGGGGHQQGGSRMPSSRQQGNPATNRGANLSKPNHALCGCINL